MQALTENHSAVRFLAAFSASCVAFIAATMPAHATCPPGIIAVPLNATQTIGNGETCIIEPPGSVATAGGGNEAINAGNNNTITNNGLLSTTGNFAPAILAGDGNLITNNGTITTSGGFSQAVHAGNNNVIINNGLMTTQQDFAEGIRAGTSTSLTNTGTIRTSGDNAEAIFVEDGSTVTNTGFLSTVGDSSFGISGEFQDDNTITNSGTITTTGNDSHGIIVDDRNTVTNTGTISTSGNGADGIEVDDDNTVTNNGAITTTGISAEAIDVDDKNTVTNTGSITTSGGGADGMEGDEDNTFINSGTIATTGNGAEGIDSGANTTVINSGTIRSARSQGIDIDNGSVTNSGLIEGMAAIEIDRTTPGDASVTNSGTIRSTQGAAGLAIDFQGVGDDALTLNPGSLIIGGINLGAGTDALTLQNGVATILTFDSLPEQITSTLPFVTSGTTVATLDPSAFGQQDEILSGLTSGIFNSIHARLASDNRAGAAVASNAMALGATNLEPPAMRLGAGGAEANNETAADTPAALWVQGFGSILRDDDNGGQVAFDSATVKTGGLIAGIDAHLTRPLKAGVFFGVARTDTAANQTGTELETDSAYGGIYASLDTGTWFFRAMVTGGALDYESDRTVLYNLSSTGRQVGTASYDGSFVSPEVALGTTFNIAGLNIEPSVRVRYAYLSHDGYAEQGAFDALSIQGRDVSLWQGRVQLAFPYETSAGLIAPRIGMEARDSDSDDVQAVLLGQALSVAPGNDEEDTTGFVGLIITTTGAHGFTAFADGEIHAGDDGLDRTEARVGFKLNF